MKKTTAILYKLDFNKIQDGIAMASLEHVEPKNGKTFELEELQSLIGGFIENVGTLEIDRKYYKILVDEEGGPKNLPINYGFWWNHGTKEGKNKFVGNVLLVPEGTFE